MIVLSVSTTTCEATSQGEYVELAPSGEPIQQLNLYEFIYLTLSEQQ